MSKTRDNHYVPQWYQKGFYGNGIEQLRYLNLIPRIIDLPNGYTKEIYSKKWYHPSRCFYQTDLYTTFFGVHINDDIERFLFGRIDDTGSKAVRAYISEDLVKQHENFEHFFMYLDAQKIRTPKGLDWIQYHYPKLTQLELMIEMQSIQAMHCTLWTEGVREIVSAKDSDVKFIISDHPVTVYNYACPPDSDQCTYPNDPSISLKATQTIYALDQDHAIILTNLEYAQEPQVSDPLEKRTHAKKVRQSLVSTAAFIRSRNLSSDEITKINFIIKSRAKQFIAAGKDEWLYPESYIKCDWADLREVLLPPIDQMFQFGGEMYVKYKDGTTHYQDAFGRTKPENKYLKKDIDESIIGRNDPCGCGSGKKYKKCCINVPINQRSSWKVRSIRERNINLYAAIYGILGLDNGKTWEDIRRELSDEQIKDIYGVYSALWQTETDIYELLPKPDYKLRGLYTGFIDPRTINFALSMTPYFDEILIQHPFLNPNNVQPEFSPIESPSKYKYQALKDIFFLLTLEPFVRSGRVNLIPDPCNFDYHLHQQMLDMAEKRKNVINFNTRDKDISFNLNREHFFRILTNLPEHIRDKEIRDAIPNISGDELAKIKLYMETSNKEDPLALLQDLDLGNGEQLFICNMTPNYEMALFIAQATGSVIVTDSETRWFELQHAQNREKGVVLYPWQRVSTAITNLSLYIEHEDIFDSIKNHEITYFRKALNNVKLMVREGCEDIDRIVKIERQIIECLSKIEKASEGKEVYLTKVQTLMPKGGFVDKNTQRLLLKSSCESYLDSVSMVIYIEPSLMESYSMDS